MSCGRPRTFDPNLVLKNALQLFWNQGYEATNLQDLMQATNLSKSSLYGSFGNKQNLFEAAFTHYFDSRAELMLAAPGRGRIAHDLYPRLPAVGAR